MELNEVKNLRVSFPIELDMLAGDRSAAHEWHDKQVKRKLSPSFDVGFMIGDWTSSKDRIEVVLRWTWNQEGDVDDEGRNYDASSWSCEVILSSALAMKVRTHAALVKLVGELSTLDLEDFANYIEEQGFVSYSVQVHDGTGWDYFHRFADHGYEGGVACVTSRTKRKAAEKLLADVKAKNIASIKKYRVVAVPRKDA